MIGYGSMALESFVAHHGDDRRALLDPGVYFAINSPAGVVGKRTAAPRWRPSRRGDSRSRVDQMQMLAKEMGETTLFARTGGAPSLAVGMATIFTSAFGKTLLSMWYHFAIMFEVLFILTTLDAGTRVGRFMLQDCLRHVWKPIGNVSSYPMTVLSQPDLRGRLGLLPVARRESIRSAASTSCGRCSASPTSCWRASRFPWRPASSSRWARRAMRGSPGCR